MTPSVSVCIFTFLIGLKFHLLKQKRFICSLTGSENRQLKTDGYAIDFYLLHHVSLAKDQIQTFLTSLAASLTLQAITDLLDHSSAMRLVCRPQDTKSSKRTPAALVFAIAESILDES